MRSRQQHVPSTLETTILRSRIGTLPAEYWLPLGAALCVLLLAPLTSIGRNLWTDEAFTASYTFYSSLGQVYADGMRNEGTPLLYFTVIWLWSHIFGHGEVALRMFSVVCGMLAAGFFGRFALRILPLRDAVLATVLIAGAPLVGQYMTEARVYTFALLVIILETALFERLTRNPTNIVVLGFYACAAIVVLYTIYFGAVVIAGQSLVWSILLLRHRDWQTFWRWSLTQILILLSILPSLPWLQYQLEISDSVTSSWVSGTDFIWLAFSLVMNLPARGLWFIPWLVCTALVWSIIVIGVMLAPASQRFPVLWSFSVPLVLMGLLIGINDDAAPRYLIVLLPGAALAFAAGLQRLRKRGTTLAPALSALVIFCLVLLRLPGLLWPEQMPARIGSTDVYPWSKLVPIAEQQANPRTDVVVFNPPWDMRVYEYYAPDSQLNLLGAHDYDTFYYYQKHPLRSTWNSQQIQTETHGYQRIWLFTDPLFHQLPAVPLPYRLVNEWVADGMTLSLYERTP